MTDIESVSQLKEFYHRKFFNSTGTILDIFPHGLFFIKSEKYLKYINCDKCPNIHIIIPKKLGLVDKKDSICFYPVDDVDFVFGEIHNYIFENYNLDFTPIIGKNCNIHHSVDLTSEGIHLYHTPYGFKKQLKHISKVIIKDNTNIGPNSVIHRGVFKPTIIGEYTSIGSLVNIGHNCIIGDHCVITPGTVIAGSCNIGNNVWFGVNSSVKHQVKICNNVVIANGANVTQDINQEGIWLGNPAKWVKPLETNKWNF